MRTEIITDYLKDKNISKAKFCKNCGISIYILNKILKQNLNIRSRYIIKIVKFFNITLDYFLKIDKVQ